MKKFILFPLYLGLFFFVACFTPKERTEGLVFMTISKDQCVDCSIMSEYKEIDNFIHSIKGIKNVEYYLNENNTTLILTVRYNQSVVKVENIKMAIKSRGFNVDTLY
tara:strand:- start:107 stop:427 length:321 start_codon:yes stop_codon:yes gene_type:complete